MVVLVALVILGVSQNKNVCGFEKNLARIPTQLDKINKFNGLVNYCQFKSKAHYYPLH